jgi:hypothetical protein
MRAQQLTPVVLAIALSRGSRPSTAEAAPKPHRSATPVDLCVAAYDNVFACRRDAHVRAALGDRIYVFDHIAAEPTSSQANDLREVCAWWDDEGPADAEWEAILRVGRRVWDRRMACGPLAKAIRLARGAR